MRIVFIIVSRYINLSVVYQRRVIGIWDRVNYTSILPLKREIRIKSICIGRLAITAVNGGICYELHLH